MSDAETTLTADALLQHTGWMKALALRLVRDASRADDIVQQALVRALERPPRDPAALRAWLARVTRNEARQWGRSEGARVQRERRVGRHRESRPASDVVERAEVHRSVVDAVLSLEEPFRTVVLLRYFDGMAPKAIAEHLGWAPGTVRSRLKRGLDRMRETLDEQADGDGRRWVFPLLVLIDPRDLLKGGAALTSAAAGGTLIVSTKLKAALLVAALLALMAGVLVWMGGDGGQGDGPRVAVAPQEPTELEAARLEGRPAAEAPAPAPTPAPASEPAPPAAPQVRLRFTDGAGEALLAEDVERRYREAGLPLGAVLVSETVLSPTEVVEAAVRRFAGSSEGRQTVAWTHGAEGLVISHEPGRWRLFVARPGAAPIVTDAFEVSAESDAAAVEIPLPQEVPQVAFQLVAAESGTPLADAKVVPYFEFGDDLAFFEGPAREADLGGVVRIPRQEQEWPMPRSRQPTWWAVAPGRLKQISIDAFRDRVGEIISLPVPLTATVTGQAYRQDGQPAAGLEVVWTRKGWRVGARVEESGRFRLEGLPGRGARTPDGASSHQIYLLEDVSNLKVVGARVEGRAGETSEVVIGSPGAADPRTTVHGRITTADGRPVPGAIVGVRREGTSKRDGGMARTDADGAYHISAPRGAVEVGVFFGGADDFYIRSAAPLDLQEDERQLDFELPGGAILVRMLDADTGQPIPGAGAYAAPQNREVAAHRFEGFVYRSGWAAMTDERGEVLLIGLLSGEPHEVRTDAEGYDKERQPDVEPARPGEPPVEVTLRLRRR